MLASSIDSLDRADAKTGVLVAAIVAAIGFSLDKVASIWEILAVLAFAWPLLKCTRAFRTEKVQFDAPQPRVFVRRYSVSPYATVTASCKMVVRAYELNLKLLETKAILFNSALIQAVIVVLFVIAVRAGEKIYAQISWHGIVK